MCESSIYIYLYTLVANRKRSCSKEGGGRKMQSVQMYLYKGKGGDGRLK